MRNDKIEQKFVYFISNTHWDREWLSSFQETRLQLVDFFKKLLNILENYDHYKAFVLDSQVAPVDDYLEICPEDLERIKTQVKAGRLLIGPWYTCPECFQVSGESIIRNLLYGHKMASVYGGVMKVGHTPFSYGQISQLPQIYNGFSIRVALYYHGVSHNEVSNEFWWEGADGTRILATQMSSEARYNFYHRVYRPAVFGEEPNDRSWEWERGQLPFKLAGLESQYDHYFLLKPQKELDEAELKERVKRLFKKECEVSLSRHILFMMGHDFSFPDELEICLVNEVQKVLEEHVVEHANYHKFADNLIKDANNLNLPVLRGERRTPKPMPKRLHLYSDVLSSRVRIKQNNYYAERDLIKLGEPMCVLASILGMEFQSSVLDLAWKELLRSQAHDTISGSGVDIIELDALSRFRQVREISKAVVKKSTAYIQSRLKLEGDKDDVFLTVYNPTSFDRKEVLECVLDIPSVKNIDKLILKNIHTGEELPVFIKSRRSAIGVVRSYENAPHAMDIMKYHVVFSTDNIPSYGYSSYIVKSSKRKVSGSLLTGDRTVENRHFRLAIRDDGTFDIFHKDSEKIYCGLGYLIDDGEAGHAWMRVSPAYDEVVDSRPIAKYISLVEDTPFSVTYSIKFKMEVPARLESGEEDICDRLDGVWNNSKRSVEKVPLDVEIRLTVFAELPSIKLVVRVNNIARDHRLRIAFPSNLDTEIVRAESAFDIVEREIVPKQNSPWSEVEHATFPLNRFVDLDDKWGGLAIITEGLKEYEVSKDPTRTIFITLLRAYTMHLATVARKWDSRPDMVLSQSPGEHEFVIWIYPHAGGTIKGRVPQEVERIYSPLIPVQSGKNEGDLPPMNSLLGISPDIIIVSALKFAEDKNGYILRVYNPSPESVNTILKINFPVKDVFEVTLEESVIQRLERISDDEIQFYVPSKKIVTLKLLV
ncbi:MAG: glycosyl hydrolase-related protein [Candidatus Hydrogenedentes bacterium]|nr:glycosyl hydrolase-related protein [Candidatus Hydrogenedentota bacterium]